MPARLPNTTASLTICAAVDQAEFVDFYLPFGGHLKASNRWSQLAERVPWDVVESCYADKLSGTGMEAPAKSRRIA